MNKNNVIKILAASVVAAFAAGCANQKPPSGGPVDFSPPEIVRTEPQNKATFFHNRSITFKFNKYVDQRSAQESIFISPYVGQPEYNWSGKEVEIRFPELLRSNTTYVVNVGTDVVDLNNTNRMAHAFTLAFSTGSTIDSAAIEGYVLPSFQKESLSGIMIFAYRLDNLDAAALDPRKQHPDFITQTGTRGDFSLHHIPVGSYRIMAVKDEYRNLLYDPETDEYALWNSDIRLTPADTLCSGLVLQLAKEDTTGPRLIKAGASDCRHLSAEFSESLMPETYTKNSFTIIDTLSRASLKIHLAYPEAEKLSVVHFITDLQDSAKTYRLFVRDACDSSGNRMNALACSMPFGGSGKADTVVFHVTSFPLKDSALAVPLDGPFVFGFSDAVQASTAEQNLHLFSAAKEDIPLEWKWFSADAAALTPKQKLQSASWYVLRGEFRSLKNWNGKTCKDSTREIHFQTLDEYDLSSIDGTVTDGTVVNGTAAKKSGSGRYIVTAFRIGSGAAKISTAVADENGNFLIQGLEEGRYVLQAYRDTNNNRRFNPGRPFPFIPAEPISAFSDTLRLRARWPLEGVKLKFHR
jgi:hypothetical protein